MAQTTTTLPDGYQLYFEMDLQKDRKLALRSMAWRCFWQLCCWCWGCFGILGGNG